MASAVVAISGVRLSAAAFASGSIVSSVRATGLNSSSSVVSFRQASIRCFRDGAMQSSVSVVSRKAVGTARRLRVSAADGSQTAEPEAVVVEPVEPKGAKKTSDEGKSTLDIVREVISEQLAVKLTELSPESKFVDLGADSLDTVEIMMSLEERFDITIEEDGTEKIATVKDAADLIDQVKKSK